MSGSLLVLTDYHPNLRDPRVLRRIERVMMVCAEMLRLEAEQPFMATDLRKLFGNYSMRETLACWLYSNLMEQKLWYAKGIKDGDSGEYIVDPHPYSYSVRVDGFNKIMRLLEQAKNEAEN